MIIYRLEIFPEEWQPEGEDFDEWFGSLEAAKRRRAELLRDGAATQKWETEEQEEDAAEIGYRWDPLQEYAIYRVDVAQRLTRAYLLKVLNGQGWCTEEKVWPVIAKDDR